MPKRRELAMIIWKRLLVVPPVLAGLALVYWTASQRTAPELAEITERRTPVAFIEVQPQRFVPSVRSFGTVQPAKSWDAVAQVRQTRTHGADDKAELDRDCQPAPGVRGEVPRGPQFGQDRRGREPCGHGEHERAREDDELAALLAGEAAGVAQRT